MSTWICAKRGCLATYLRHQFLANSGSVTAPERVSTLHSLPSSLWKELAIMRDLTNCLPATARPPVLELNQLTYSDKYSDDDYEYRHIIVPKEYVRYLPRTHLLTETEWRNIGIQQSPGWEHYMIHTPGP